MSGDDGLTLPFMACGAKGVISVASNLIPEVVSDMVALALGGEFESQRDPSCQLSFVPGFILRTQSSTSKGPDANGGHD